MIKLNSKALSFLVAVSVISYSGFSFAEKGGHGHKEKFSAERFSDDDREGDNHHDRPDKRHHSGKIIISNPDRVVIQRYIVEDYRSHCPPGLAKKHKGCMPPGQYKKRYQIGRPLPEHVVYEPLPRDWPVHLQPVPAGYQYVRVDKDVLLISEGSKNVIDAITLFSAVGN